jgi:hypothetical protein
MCFVQKSDTIAIFLHQNSLDSLLKTILGKLAIQSRPTASDFIFLICVDAIDPCSQKVPEFVF